MAVQIKHATTAVGTEAGDGEIGKTEWNEAHTLTLETSKLLGRITAGSGAVEEVPLLDEDDMASDSATSVPTQQSVKAYVDAEVGAIPIGSSGTSELVVITTTSNFIKANYSGLKSIEVWAIGSGDDGGTASGTFSSSKVGGRGGGAGGVAYSCIDEADLAASISITISGGSTTFAHSTSLVGNDASAQDGGSATGGDINITGQDGAPGHRMSSDNTTGGAPGGMGGSTPFGFGMGGRGANAANNSGGAGTGYGSGGGGASSNTTVAGTGSGGSGAPGAVIIKVHY